MNFARGSIFPSCANASNKRAAMKLFLSYSHRDRPFAERLGAQLRALGADVLSDYSSVRPGDDLQAALRDALEAADGVILVVPEPGAPGRTTLFSKPARAGARRTRRCGAAKSRPGPRWRISGRHVRPRCFQRIRRRARVARKLDRFRAAVRPCSRARRVQRRL